MADCLFCRIVAGDIPADVVAEFPRTVAFRDIVPQAPVHVLVVPREHYADVAYLVAADPDLATLLLADTTRVASDLGLSDGGYRIVFNTGVHGGQTVPHVHAHVLGGRPMGWPPG